MRSCTVVSLVAVLFAISASASQPPIAPPPRPALTSEQKEMIAEAQLHSKRSSELEKAGKYKDALVAAEKMLAIERAVYGNTHVDVAGSLNRIGRLQMRLENWSGAGNAYRESAELRAALSTGKDAWRVADSRQGAADADLFAKLAPTERADVRKATELHEEAVRLQGQGKLTDATKRCLEVLALRKQLLGAAHPDTLASLHALGQLANAQGRHTEADSLYKEALVGRRKVFGDDHPTTLTSLNNLGSLYGDQDRYAEAEPLLKAALSGFRSALGEGHPNTLLTMNNLGAMYKSQGKFAEAEPLYKEALAGRRKALGDDHRDTLTTMNSLGVMYKTQGKYAEAESLLREVLTGRRKTLGNSHRDTLTSLTHLGSLYKDQGKYAEAEPLYKEALATRRKVLGEAHPDTLINVANFGLLYKDQRKYTEAEPLYQEVLAARRKALGDDHTDTLTSLNNLGLLYAEQRRYAEAEPLYKETLERRRKVLGDTHPSTLTSLTSLGQMYQAQGKYTEAEPLLRETLEGRKKTLGDTHSDTLVSQNNLGVLYSAQGKYAEAELLHKQVLETRRKVLGDSHPNTLTSLSSLGVLYAYLGRNADAEPLLKECLAIRRKVLGDSHPDTLLTLGSLASVYRRLGRQEQAEPLFKEAVAGCRSVLGNNHPDTLSSMNNLGSLYKAQDKYAEAESVYKEVLATRRKVLGETHPDTLLSMNNLGSLYNVQDKHAEAEPLYKEALAGFRKTFGDIHPYTLTSLHNLGGLCNDQGRQAEAETLLKEALAGSKILLDRTAAGQTEAAQITFRTAQQSGLHAFLSLGRAGSSSIGERYVEVLAWKGAALARRSQLRAAVEGSGDGDLKALFAESSEVARRIANLAAFDPPPGQLATHRKTLATLTERKDAIDRELARKSEPFRRAKETATLTPEQLAQALPPGVALVDFLEYRHFAPDPKQKGKMTRESRFLAYVVRNGQPVVEVELGPVAPIAEAVDQWRANLGRTQPVRDEKDPAAVLRRIVWEPVAKHLGNATTVLISPDGVLGKLPFGALPDTDPAKYLVEEVAISVVPVPQLIPELLSDRRQRPKAESLLLVGDVDYDAEPGQPASGVVARTADTATRSGSSGKWSHLPGTATEAKTIRELFTAKFPGSTTTVLDRTAATESAVRTGAPASRYVHIATHGFFAPPRKDEKGSTGDIRGPEETGFDRRRTADIHPGLQAGLVLAGANRKPQPGADDGVLTALEVSELDLSGVELAVLSACETRLGKAIGGEGALGLERALQAAGVRSTVTSLWKVPDRATEALMVRFYGNMWDKKMGKLAALREAQLWLLKEGAADPALARGATVDEPDTPPVPKGGRLPPYYWAAFTLAGDWR